ncbi:hypothetical protein HYALB_00010931 [Hymenoscyphus albidus]|uniref:Carbohydrate esterase family 4 protein n=1 Tax=Hymenoscyphus albidus TaxID=595503 RepID=A0A9N9LI03_9HELO|nr:hypothetical protein HYALB_00010931 [Hymenoscyphus albidus]
MRALALTLLFSLVLAFASALQPPNPQFSGGEGLTEIQRAINISSPDNTCGKSVGKGKGYICNPAKNAGGCCSGAGWCGWGDDYCGPTCQPLFSLGKCNTTTTTPPPLSDDFLCGPQNGNKKCSGNGCCSQYGYCGITFDYCSTSCQSTFGKCTLSPTNTSSLAPLTPYPTATPTSTPTNDNCGAANGNLSCPTGWCGTTSDYCAVGCQPNFGRCDEHSNSTGYPEPDTYSCGAGLGICNNDQCCSKNGYCGRGEDYCSDPQWCQTSYGRCDSDTTPLGKSTANVPRPWKGSVPYDEDIYDCQKSRVVALTYDDGPSPYTAQLLDLLKAYGFHATFFVTGNNNGKGPIDTTAQWSAVIRRMIAEGHQVASHSWSHYEFDSIGHDERMDQMIKNEMAFNNIIGKFPTYMRPPYSNCSQTTGCWADMQALGYHRIYFDLDTDDTNNETPDNIQNSKNDVRNMLSQGPAGGNFLSIQHDISEQSVKSLSSYYFDLIKKKGWRGVTVGECLGDEEENWYRVM